MTTLAACGIIRVHYDIQIPNVGDAISPSIVTALTGRCVKYTGDESEPHLLAIGSIMASSTPLSRVWGTGVMHPTFGIGGVKADNVHALRGRLSQAVLQQNGLNVADVPLGDPAYLAPSLLGIRRSEAPKFPIGLVPHYVDRYHPVLRRMMTEPGVVDLNVHVPPEAFLKQMADCEIVLSTSLHGLIFAEALGIPSLWLKASDDIAGGEFKFEDWYTTTTNPQRKPHPIRSGDTAAKLAVMAERRTSTIDVDALRAAFPHSSVEAMEFAPSVIPASACRARPTPVFLISFERPNMLKRSIEAVRRLARATEIVVHDRGSTSGDTLTVLDDLEKSGLEVHRFPSADFVTDLQRVNETIQGYFSDWAEPARYVVSDGEIDTAVIGPRALDMYDELLNRFHRIECVGPTPLVGEGRHVSTSLGDVTVLESALGAPLALHRAGATFRPAKSVLLVREQIATPRKNSGLNANPIEATMGGKIATSVASYLQTDVPVFVPCLNQSTYAARMLSQLRELGFRRIVLLDGGSTYRPMLDLLADPGDGVSVVSLATNPGPHHLLLDPAAFALLPRHFCLTDPDLEFNPAMPRDFLGDLAALAARERVGKAGLALNIPDRDAMVDETFSIADREWSISEWEQQFWRDELTPLRPGGDPVYRATVDTTFALYDKEFFDPNKPLEAVRVAGRFACRHLPWYRENRLPEAEERFYRATQRYSHYFGVNASSNGDPAPSMGDLAQAPHETLYSVDWIAYDGVSMPVSSLNVPLAVRRGTVLNISGWAVDEAAKLPAGGVITLVDGRSPKSAKYGSSRLDVAHALTEPAYESSGFLATIGTAALSQGTHEISFAVIDRAGHAYYPVKSTVEIEII